ncbi:acyclic terpene utilization AtuA family protein [Fulvimarina endophytica]|uniref:Acyclic terpene utilization AtuA family protein n=1 Tax=Fulvimarina endophytica TaxID=2293836 RepID=A0A371WYG3_9HYPH|nr:acyclic terpene utilization AtuA family protein [Fulvimarina endophytica]RFC62030.1 acyclic terpene utilization AtuA family protein [Fulvimarina endophytica]
MLSTSGILGYGYAEESLKIGMSWEPHVIGCDGGSTDPGPYYLGAGKSFTSRLSVKRDLRLMLQASVAAGIPCIIGTAGGAGGEPHLKATADLVREIAREEKLSFKMALIHSEQPKADLRGWAEAGRTRPLARMKPLDGETIDRSERVVAMMGPEPFARALDEGAQVILAGRSSDPAQWAAPAIRAGMAPAPSWYAGKMLECGAEPTVPKEPDCIFLRVRNDHVVCEPPNPIRRSTPLAVANFALHENSSPIHHVEPGGLLDTSACRFIPVSDRAVKIDGMTWTPADQYTVKLEGVELAGYRAIAICGTRDPVLISQIEDYLTTHREKVLAKAEAFGVPRDAYTLIVHTYGRNGVMGGWEPLKEFASHELGFVIEVVARDQDTANAVLAMARTSMLHADFPGRLCKEGNMAFPFSPSDIEMGAMYRFNVFHTLSLDDPCAIFPIEYEKV